MVKKDSIIARVWRRSYNGQKLATIPQDTKIKAGEWIEIRSLDGMYVSIIGVLERKALTLAYLSKALGVSKQQLIKNLDLLRQLRIVERVLRHGNWYYGLTRRYRTEDWCEEDDVA